MPTTSSPSARPDLLATGALVWAAFVFGTSFVVVKGALDDVDPIPYVWLRFAIAGAAFALLARRRPADPRMRPLAWATGATYAIGMSLQAIGLQTIDASTSAFLTYLLVVLVPLIVWRWKGQAPGRSTVVAVGVAVVGLVLLTGGGAGLSRGAVLTLIAAVAFAVHLIQVGEAAMRGYDLLRFNTLQCLAVAAILTPLVPFTGGVPTTATGWGVAAYAGIIVTVATLVPWMWAQRRVSATRAALILLLEPVFAALAGYANGERLTAAEVAGACLILAAAVLAELPSMRRATPVAPS